MGREHPARAVHGTTPEIIGHIGEGATGEAVAPESDPGRSPTRPSLSALPGAESETRMLHAISSPRSVTRSGIAAARSGGVSASREATGPVIPVTGSEAVTHPIHRSGESVHMLHESMSPAASLLLKSKRLSTTLPESTDLHPSLPRKRRGKAPPIDSFDGESPDVLFEDWVPVLTLHYVKIHSCLCTFHTTSLVGCSLAVCHVICLQRSLTNFVSVGVAALQSTCLQPSLCSAPEILLQYP